MKEIMSSLVFVPDPYAQIIRGRREYVASFSFCASSKSITSVDLCMDKIFVSFAMPPVSLTREKHPPPTKQLRPHLADLRFLEVNDARKIGSTGFRSF
jgi:hypothetical protein